MLCGFVAYCSLPLPRRIKGLAPSTIKNYLSAVAYAHLIHGYAHPWRDKPLLQLIRRGHKRKYGAHRKQKRPITISLLRLFASYRTTHADHLAVWAIMCLGVYGLLRLGELLPSSILSKQLTTSSIRWYSSTHASLHLKSSKTDPFGEGYTIHYFANGDITCPIEALRAIYPKDADLSPEVPLFRHSDGRAWTRSQFITAIRWFVQRTEDNHKLGLKAKAFAGHSLRRGGATSLALRGVPSHVVKMLGRWASDAYRIYMDTPPTTLSAWSKLMSSATTEHSTADIDASLRPSAGPKLWD